MGTLRLTLTHSPSDLLARIWHRIQSDNCFDLAAEISFFFSLSFLPFCLVLAMVVGWLPSTLLWKPFATWIVTYLPADSQHLIFSTILGLVDYSTGFFSFGLITALWSASSGFVSLMESLSVVYAGRDSRSFWHKHVIAACIALLAMVFALACFGLAAFGHWGYEWSAHVLGRWTPSRPIWEFCRWIFTLVVLCLAVDLVNFVLPDARRRWHWLTPGTAFVVLTLVASSAGFNLYFRHFTAYPRVYGTLGGFIVLMLWIYTANVILLIGAETDREIEMLASEMRLR
jgi:membrane protein